MSAMTRDSRRGRLPRSARRRLGSADITAEDTGRSDVIRCSAVRPATPGGSRPRRRRRRCGGARGRAVPAAASARSASTVDRRSSCNATGTSTTFRSASANDSAWTARSPRSPRSERGRPSTMSVAPRSRARAATASSSPGGCPTCTVPTGTASRRSGSETATPIRASPRSSPRTGPRTFLVDGAESGSG